MGLHMYVCGCIRKDSLIVKGAIILSRRVSICFCPIAEHVQKYYVAKHCLHSFRKIFSGKRVLLQLTKADC